MERRNFLKALVGSAGAVVVGTKLAPKDMPPMMAMPDMGDEPISMQPGHITYVRVNADGPIWYSPNDKITLL